MSTSKLVISFFITFYEKKKIKDGMSVRCRAYMVTTKNGQLNLASPMW